MINTTASTPVLEVMTKAVLKDFPQLTEDVKIDFVSSLPTNLLCIRCRAIPGVLWRTTCNDGFCSECLSEVLDGSVVVCPVHKTSVHRQQLERDAYTWRVVQYLVARCLWRDEGCREEGPLSRMQYHFLKCSYKLISCPDCSIEVPRHALSSHLSSKCQKMNGPSCIHCSNSQFDEHEEEEDIDGISDPAIRQCKLAVLGCKFKGTAQQLRKHETFKNHVEIMTDFTKVHEKEMENFQLFSNDTSNEIKTLQNEIQDLKVEREGLLVELNVAREEIKALHSENRHNKAHTDNLRVQVMELSQQVKLLACGIVQDPFYWYLSPYESHLQRYKKMGGVHVLFSDPFYTGVPGYRFRLRLLVDLHSKTVHLAPQLLPGQFNNIISWPFKPNYIMRLVNQNSTQNHIEVSVTRSLPETLEKPPDSGRLLTCNTLQVPMDVLESRNYGYLVSDTVIFMFKMGK